MRVITFPELKSRKGIPYTRVHTRRLMAADEFPQSFRLGANTIAWDEEEIDRWLTDRRAAGRASTA